ncbi:glycosyltransferase family 4 protein [Methylomonas sp. MO1]|uniref:glycosyltransferase family 4 protein n=1 Tax=Methylomonas sp. MO1 TaxID=3073619 RepID=UPI0028A4CF08|nr:glycosyltransferase family 4 protein [Methylomonas sp. MO1]MDT4289249.1 glycosyltransferase family 4 protein [Methylomonas sp. MO1]
MKLHIGIAAPIATEHVANLLSCDTSELPKGYPGAPFTGVLIGELLKQGHRVSAFTTDSSLYPNKGIVKVSGANFDFYICPSRPRAWRLNNHRLGRAVDGFAYERQQLYDAMQLAKPLIIHAHWTYEFALPAIKTGLPHLITCHDAPAVILRYTRSVYRAIRYLLARQVFRKARNLSAVSSYMASAVQHYTSIPISLVPNPLADYVLSQGKPRNAPKHKRIGMICNGWDERKNPEPALRAFAKLNREHPAAQLHLFGMDFGPNQTAQQWCEKNGLAGGMVFHGSTPHQQLIDKFSKLELLLHPSLEESFGVVIAEAMALGLPVVAGRRSGAVPWVVGFDETANKICCAVLTDMTDSDAIVLAIKQAFDEQYGERSEMGYTRARQMFAPDVIAGKYLSLYENILFSNAN